MDRAGFDYSIYKNPEYEYTDAQYKNAVREISAFISVQRYAKQTKYSQIDCSVYNDKIRDGYIIDCGILADRLREACGGIWNAVNCSVDFFYSEKPTANRSILWDALGKYICSNIRNNMSGKPTFPVKDPDGEILYLGNRYRCTEIKL